MYIVCITIANNPLNQPPRGLPSKPFVTGPEAHLQSWFGGFELRQKYKTRKKIQQTTSAILRSRTFIWGADLPTGQRGAGFWLVSDGTLSRITARDPSAKNLHELYFDLAILSRCYQFCWRFLELGFRWRTRPRCWRGSPRCTRSWCQGSPPRSPPTCSSPPRRFRRPGQCGRERLQGLSRCLRSSTWSTSS